MGKKKKKDAAPPQPKVPAELMADLALLQDRQAVDGDKAMACSRLGAFAAAADVQRNDLGAAGCIEMLVAQLVVSREPIPRSLRTGAAAAVTLAARKQCEEQITYALRQLSANNPLSIAYDNAARVVDAGGPSSGVMALLALLQAPGKHCHVPTVTCKEHAVACLCNLAKKNKYREAIVACGGVDSLIYLLRDDAEISSASLRRDAAFCLGGIAFCHEANKRAVIQAGAVPVLEAIVQDMNEPRSIGLGDGAAAQARRTAEYALKNILEPPRLPAQPPPSGATAPLEKKT